MRATRWFALSSPGSTPRHSRMHQSTPFCRVQPQKAQPGRVGWRGSCGWLTPSIAAIPASSAGSVAKTDDGSVILHLKSKGDCWEGFPSGHPNANETTKPLGGIARCAPIGGHEESPRQRSSSPSAPARKNGYRGERREYPADLAGLLDLPIEQLAKTPAVPRREAVPRWTLR